MHNLMNVVLFYEFGTWAVPEPMHPASSILPKIPHPSLESLLCMIALLVRIQYVEGREKNKNKISLFLQIEPGIMILYLCVKDSRAA